MRRDRHWDRVYTRDSSTSLGWYQPLPTRSLALIREAGIRPEEPVIDIGGGASLLVDHLLGFGFADITVLDLSHEALAQSKERLGDRAGRVHWLVQDVTTFAPQRTFSLWHDRALLHFLTRKRDRLAYRGVLCGALHAHGTAIIATFAPSGARRCAGLPVRRYSPDDICDLVGRGFHLLSTSSEIHVTPTGVEQPYHYFLLRREEAA